MPGLAAVYINLAQPGERDKRSQQVDPNILARLRALSVDEQQWVEAPPEMRELVLNVFAGVSRLESSVRDALKPA